MAKWARSDGPARKRPDKARPSNGPVWSGSCLGPAWHDCRVVPRPPPRHGDPTRARHEIGPARCQSVNFSLLRAHPTISYKNRIPPILTIIPHFFSFSWGDCVALVSLRPPPPPPRLGAELTASSSATARRRAGRLLLRHGQAAPAASSSATARRRANRLPSSARARPRAGRRFLPTTRPCADRCLLPHGQAARRPLPLPPRRPQASGIYIVARHRCRPPGATSPPKKGRRRAVVGAQSGPMGLMGRRALPCLGPGQHDTRGIIAVPGPPPRPGGPTWPGTEVHLACIVSGRVGPGRIGLGPG
jgi:hypothetical protein